MEDSQRKPADTLIPQELEAALEKLGEMLDVPAMHSALTEFLRDLDLPEDLIRIEVLQFRRELTRESDRGAALFAAAHLDEALALMLKAFLVQDDAVASSLFSGTAALATFSARIDLAYLLGLVPASVRRELHLIRKIRNDFAHGTKMLRFDAPAIAARCRELTRASFAVDPRHRFIQAAMSIIGIIEGSTKLLGEGRKPRCVAAEEIHPANPDMVRKALVLMASNLQSAVPIASDDGVDPMTEKR